MCMCSCAYFLYYSYVRRRVVCIFLLAAVAIALYAYANSKQMRQNRMRLKKIMCIHRKTERKPIVSSAWNTRIEYGMCKFVAEPKVLWRFQFLVTFFQPLTMQIGNRYPKKIENKNISLNFNILPSIDFPIRDGYF